MSQVEIIKASAGSGKTFELAKVYLQLLVEGESPRSILATTFTRKAAGEIRERILSWLVTAASSAEGSKEINSYLGLEVDEERYYQVLSRFIDCQNKELICTLDSFFSRIARLYPTEVALPPMWGQAPEALVSTFQLRAVQSLFSSEEISELVRLLEGFIDDKSPGRFIQSVVRKFSEFNSYTSVHGKQAVVPASLKSRPADVSFLDLLEKHRELTPALTKQGKPRSRWKKRLDEDAQSLKEGDFEQFLKSNLVYAALDGGTFDGAELESQHIEVLDKLAQYCSLKVVDKKILETSRLVELFLRYQEHLLSSFDEHNLATFDHVKEEVSSIASLEVFERLDSQIRHVLLDEFQDTSTLQWNVLKPLCLEIDAGSSEPRRLLCVGDEKQAVYAWRGGNSEIFGAIEKELRTANQSFKQLSYRSAPEVIEAVNRVFTSDLIEPLWRERFREHETTRTDLSGYAVAQIVEDPKERILELLEGDIAILLRTNKQIVEYSDYLIEAGFGDRLSIEGKKLLRHDLLVSSVLSLVQYFYSPSFTLAQFSYQNSPVSFVTEKEEWWRELLFRKGIAYFVRCLCSDAVCRDKSVDSVEVHQFVSWSAEFDENKSDVPQFISGAQSAGYEASGSGLIKLMTIHKSKGLEFDTVILPELGWKLVDANSKKFLNMPESRNFTPGVLMRPNNSVSRYFSDLESLKEEESLKAFHESLNLLYVALTRAKRKLYCLSPEPKKGTAAQIVFGGLNEVGTEEFGKVHVSDVEGNFLVRPETIEIQPLELTVVSRASEELSESSTGANLHKGIMEHARMESFTFIEECDFPQESLRDEPLVETYFSRKRYSAEAQVFNELPYMRKEGRKIISGRIDRLVVDGGKAEVFDYKFSSEKLEYSRQLEEYRAAVSQLFDLDKRLISCFLVYLMEDTFDIKLIEQ